MFPARESGVLRGYIGIDLCKHKYNQHVTKTNDKTNIVDYTHLG